MKEKIRKLPETPGVYLMKDRLGSVIYVGKAKNLRKRVSSYFQPSRKFRIEQPKVAAMVDLVADLEIMEVASESEALLLEGRLIKEWKPRYNTDFTDDKRFLLVRVDVEQTIPRFRLVRFRSDERSLYYGPFAHSGMLRRTLGELRLKFGILLADASPRQIEDGRWRLYDDIRSEIYGLPNVVTVEEYRDRVEKACAFLDGKSREWLGEMEQAMQAAAERLDFERAAELRDLLRSLRRTIEKTRKFVRIPVNSGDELGLRMLQSHLGLARLPRVMECFDISHISGSFCVASMVRFVEGKPDRSQYRRYKIRSFTGNDDFRAMEEVVGRRYRRLADEQRAFPNLVVIDGGAGQVAAAERAFRVQGMESPSIIGLAKREEMVVFGDDRPDLALPGHDEGRLLLQRIRDEAHRFANAFNAELRRQQMKATVLDDFPGLGPRRRAALLKHFRTIEAIRKADEAVIAQVPGIGPKFAARLKAFLTGG